MSDDAKISITISVDLLLPVPEESLESYLDYLETSVLFAGNVHGFYRGSRRRALKERAHAQS